MFHDHEESSSSYVECSSPSDEDFLDDRAVSDLSESSSDDQDDFLDDRPVAELSEHSTEDSVEESSEEATRTKRRRADRNSSSDEYEPELFEPRAQAWGCVVVVGRAEPSGVECFILRTHPGDLAISVFDYAMSRGYYHTDVCKALELLGLVQGKLRALSDVQKTPLPPLGPCSVFFIRAVPPEEAQ